ncbi:hypothetical protein PHYBOEH_009670 [Phytophthora boehmeriae]|uniref:Acyltransferase n=1 Tax=Phytophthora boehmeriae TaxID=109152 RepID=A0A8T1VST9_9STRA|nr:hypothetical protein PHYBOEH_009670 [Phytophthora boehmeriae]
MDPKLRASDNQSQHRQDVLVYDAPGFFAENSRVPLWTQNLLTDLFSFVTTHYFIWSWPVVALFYYLYKNGLGYVVVAILVLYVPPFFNGVHKTGQGNEWGIVRTSSLWGMMNKVLRTKIIREQPLDPTKKYVFGFHPHGILVLSRLAICGGNFENVIPDITYRILGASAMYFVPLGREFCLWMGGVDASRSTADKVFKEGNSVVVYPGGTAEIFRTDPYSTETQLVLQERLGFIKLAMSHGADLVPTFVFGEKWLYNMWTPPKGVTDFFRKTLRIPVLVFWGKFWWIPKAPPAGKRFGLVYGNPIATKLTPNPTESELRAVHEKYVAEIHRIFEEHKADFGYGEDETLAII